jgi:hypothetical protein
MDSKLRKISFSLHRTYIKIKTIFVLKAFASSQQGFYFFFDSNK